MSGRRLAAHVYVGGRSFAAGDRPPTEFADQITNPNAWEGAQEGGPPPRAGKGSGTEAWVAYARENDVAVNDDDTREAVIAACEAAGVPVE